jgi:segregation and condensation protein A
MASNDSHLNGDSDFEEDALRDGAAAGPLLLDLDGYEGPIDLLLDLARDQKVDLTKISILQLADQYLAFISRARELRLELAADYLVMAAWLAYLKSRLLLPVSREEGEEPSAEEMAARLAFQLQHLEAMRKAGQSLLARPQLNRDFFPRGAPEPAETSRRSVYQVTLYELLRAYSSFKARDRITALRIDPSSLYSTERALERLRSMIGSTLDWTDLSAFLPKELANPLLMRSALASTFSATLEMVKAGELSLRQSGIFAPLYLRRRTERKQRTETRS